MLQSGFHLNDPGGSFFTIYGPEIPIFLVLAVVLIGAEVVLARKERPWPGLILPGLCLLLTVLRLIVRVVQVIGVQEVVAPGRLLLLVLLAENIPTLLLLAVYGLCRLCKQWRTRRQLNKTRIDDL